MNEEKRIEIDNLAVGILKLNRGNNLTARDIYHEIREINPRIETRLKGGFRTFVRIINTSDQIENKRVSTYVDKDEFIVTKQVYFLKSSKFK